MNEEKPVGTISDYLEQIKRLRKEWKFNTQDELWFRGESCQFPKTRLLPKVYRPDHPTDFLLDNESRILKDFERNAPHLADIDWPDRFEAYMQMQHHGGPTRLLDWSEGALTALHFAVKRAKPDDKRPRFIYAIDPNWLNDETQATPANEKAVDENGDQVEVEDEEVIDRYLPDQEDEFKSIPNEPLVLEFQLTTRRMGAQRSRFILCGRDRMWLPSRVGVHGSRLRMISVATGAASDLREELRICGVTESVIFPDLDALGREMADRWDSLTA